MSKFKNRLASIVLSTITLAGGVTTCLISDSAVYQCQATITDEEMKKLINEALTDSFNQDPLLPQITADNLKEVLQKALYTIIHGKQGEPLTEKERNNLQTLVNTFLFHLSCCLIHHLVSPLPDPANRSSVITDKDRDSLMSYAPGPGISMGFAKTVKRLMTTNVPTHQTYFPENFFTNWWIAQNLNHDFSALQSLLK